MSWQIAAFTRNPLTGDYVYSVLCDTAADLPASITGTDYDGPITQGCTATIIADGSKYTANSSGTWVLQPTSSMTINLPDVYSEAEVDALLAPMQDDITKTNAVLPVIVDEGGKNTMKYTLTDLQTQNTGGGYGFTWTDNVCTSSRGVTFTVNSDMSIRVQATASSGDVWFLLENHAYNIGDWILSGCPANGDTTKYYIESDNRNARDIGNSVQITVDSAFSDNVYIVVKSGQTFDLTFKPMICKKLYWDISPDFEPYCPTLPELYATQYIHDSVQVNLNDITWTQSGGGLYYSQAITIPNSPITKIYHATLSGFANIRATDNIIPAVRRSAGWAGFGLYANTNSFASGAWVTVSVSGTR